MGFLLPVLTVIGLALFEIVTSIDNAVINAEVLATMGAKMRRWFLVWGLLIAVFLVRGLLPFLLVYFTLPEKNLLTAIHAVFFRPEETAKAVEAFSPVLLVAGGTFLIFLFFHWLFLEPKNFGLRGERFFQRQGAWFYAAVSILLSAIVWFALKRNPLEAFGAVVGSTAFFIIHGFRGYAEEQEKTLMKGHLSDISKLLYLEVLDASFSIDGVVGAFAFTFIVPLILIGNGIGAFVLREITVHNVDRIKKYPYLKNGAMYSIMALGTIMVLDSFGFDIPSWVSPLITFAVVGYFFYLSLKAAKKPA